MKITSKIDSEKKILSKIDFLKKHVDTITLVNEVQNTSSYLKNIGYFTNSIDSIIREKETYTAYFSLNKKTKSAFIVISKNSRYLFKGLPIKNSLVEIPIEELQNKLAGISKKLDNEGKSFSKVQLKNIILKKNNLFANLDIYQSKQRTINKVIIKGYDEFPNSFLKNYFSLSDKTVFNQKKIKEISSLSKNLQFAKEIKPPEILFTKGSTFLYIYLKKQQNNSFDGIVNFASKKNGGVLFNGNIDLKLNNILNTGEKFNLFWNSIGEEKQEFKLSTEIPYLLNSKFTPELSFSIYKQDSTFLNTKFDSKLFYDINSKTKLALTYNSESSENLGETTINNIETYTNYFVGFQFQYRTPKNDYFFNDKFHIQVNPTFGKRKNNKNSSNQFKFEAISSYIWDINLRSSVFIRNETGYLNSDSFVDNELFRIGGANSIRGFNEQSIFANNYTYFNIEYRYLISKKSYLYSITDIAKINHQIKNENLLGLGVGYLFKVKNSLINIGYIFGKREETKFTYNNSKLSINWRSFF